MVLVLVAAILGASPTYTIRGTIDECSGEHTVYVALVGKRFFDTDEPLKTRKIPASKVKDGKVTYVFKVRPGKYAVLAFEDENNNGDLDMGFFGPSEPAQFYREFTDWRAPRFEDIAFTVKANVTGADIELD